MRRQDDTQDDEVQVDRPRKKTRSSARTVPAKRGVPERRLEVSPAKIDSCMLDYHICATGALHGSDAFESSETCAPPRCIVALTAPDASPIRAILDCSSSSGVATLPFRLDLACFLLSLAASF